MTSRSVIHRLRRSPFLLLMRKHAPLVTILTVLAILAGSQHFLRGNLIVGTTIAPMNAGTSSADPLPDLRTCSGTGTVFQNLWNYSAVEQMFLEQMRAVTNERLQLLSGPSRWSCLKGQEPPMPVLETMARGLPGWYFREQSLAPGGVATKTSLRPVTWNAYSSIVTEFERVYECKLSEISYNGTWIIENNLDYDQIDSNGITTMFCCDESQNGCVRQETGTTCSTPPTIDPHCDNQCGVAINVHDIATRLPSLLQRMAMEGSHARTALRRTMGALRSFELNYAVARQLNCYARASFDLQNEMSLLSDTASCLPRIWDTLTSLHDRKDTK